MGIQQDKSNPNLYRIASESRKGVFYEVDLKENTCSCPSFQFHGGKHGKGCKHLDEVKKSHHAENTGKPTIGSDKKQKVLDYLEEHKQEEVIFLMEKFGDDVIHELLAENAIIEEHGRVRIL